MGADIEAKNKFGATALHMALVFYSHGNDDVSSLPEKGADIRFFHGDFTGMNVVYSAELRRMIESLLPKTFEDGKKYGVLVHITGEGKLIHFSIFLYLIRSPELPDELATLVKNGVKGDVESFSDNKIDLSDKCDGNAAFVFLNRSQLTIMRSKNIS